MQSIGSMPLLPLTLNFPLWIKKIIWISGLWRHYVMIMAIHSNHSQDNSCKCNICPVSLSKICTKLQKSTHDNPKNLSSSKGGQDTPTCHIWGHSLQYLLQIMTHKPPNPLISQSQNCTKIYSAKPSAGSQAQNWLESYITCFINSFCENQWFQLSK